MQRHNLYACPSGIICGRLAAGRGLLQRHNLYAYPVGDSLQSPVGVVENMQGAKPVRLAAVAFLLLLQKEAKQGQGGDSPLTNPLLSLAVLDTNDAKHRPYCAQIRSKGSRGRIFIAPALERGRANHHPCPLL